jgi:hypothetical protein
MPNEVQTKDKFITATDKARDLVRTIMTEDFRHKISQKTINDVAEKIVKALPKKTT